MENNQSTQQTSELGDSKLVRSSRRTALSDNLNYLLMLFKRWNWLMWVGAWVVLLGIIAISILSLVYPTNLSQKAEPKTVAAENKNETSSQTGSPPLWVVGAAVTFAVGSLVIFKRLSSSSHSDKTRRRFSGRSLTRRQQRKLLIQGHSSSPTQPELLLATAPMPVELEPVVMLPLEESNLVNLGEESLAEMLGDRPPSASELTAGECLDAESEPLVTVLPPESSYLVDSEESLAEMMDIRRHRSLASILKNFKI